MDDCHKQTNTLHQMFRCDFGDFVGFYAPYSYDYDYVCMVRKNMVGK